MMSHCLTYKLYFMSLHIFQHTCIVFLIRKIYFEESWTKILILLHFWHTWDWGFSNRELTGPKLRIPNQNSPQVFPPQSDVPSLLHIIVWIDLPEFTLNTLYWIQQWFCSEKALSFKNNRTSNVDIKIFNSFTVKLAVEEMDREELELGVCRDGGRFSGEWEFPS